MTTINTRSFTPVEMLGAALSTPVFSLLVAMAVAVVIALVASRRRGSDPGFGSPSERSRWATEHLAIGLASLGVLIVFLAEFAVRGYVSTDLGIAWWRFAVPTVAAAVGVGAVLLLIVTRGTEAPKHPVGPSTRRDWTTFTSHRLLLMSAVAVLTLVITTIAAGSASSPDGEGNHVWLTIPIPNESEIDPIRVLFFGWTYGVPTLVGAVLLAAVTWSALSRNAARPFLRPETIVAERTARRNTARGILFLAIAAILLSLAGAWRLIAQAGSGAQLTILGQNGDAPYDASWQFAELAIAVGWGAPILEIAAFTLLFLAISMGVRRQPSAHDSRADAGELTAVGAPL